MSTGEQGALLTLDPDARAARSVRSTAARTTTAARSEPARVTAQAEQTELIRDTAKSASTEPALAEAGPAAVTLSLEPFRAPITALVTDTLRAEREVLERIASDLRAELEQLQAWRVREEAMRADQTAHYRRAAEEWGAAGTQATALKAGSAHLLSAIQDLQVAVHDAGTRFWRRAMLAAWVVALTGLGLVGGLCGVVWLALAQH